jgi:hypothetical protein
MIHFHGLLCLVVGYILGLCESAELFVEFMNTINF